MADAEKHEQHIHAPQFRSIMYQCLPNTHLKQSCHASIAVTEADLPALSMRTAILSQHLEFGI
jgi:hypothetical protein